MTIISNRRLADELIKRGLVPDECRLIAVNIGVQGAVTVIFETYLTGERARLFGEAFAAISTEPKVQE